MRGPSSKQPHRSDRVFARDTRLSRKAEATVQCMFFLRTSLCDLRACHVEKSSVFACSIDISLSVSLLEESWFIVIAFVACLQFSGSMSKFFA